MPCRHARLAAIRGHIAQQRQQQSCATAGSSGAPVPAFHQSQHAAAAAFFQDNGFVVVADALSTAECAALNCLCDRSQLAEPTLWGAGRDDTPAADLFYFQPLLDHPELDPYTRHPATFGLVSALLGGEPRFSEFDFRCAWDALPLVSAPFSVLLYPLGHSSAMPSLPVCYPHSRCDSQLVNAGRRRQGRATCRCRCTMIRCSCHLLTPM